MMNDLMDIIVAEDRLRLGNALLKKHGRTDLKIIAVNRMYGWSFVCLDSKGKLCYYVMDKHHIR